MSEIFKKSIKKKDAKFFQRLPKARLVNSF